MFENGCPVAVDLSDERRTRRCATVGQRRGDPGDHGPVVVAPMADEDAE
ncbi:hypothetical protein [Pseudonocardia sp.]